VLSVVIDNVIAPGEMSAAAGKGVVTGATFFIAGSNITDHYICTVDYVANPTAPKITRTARHAVITQMGLINSPPEGAVKIGSMKDAIFTMARQIVANPLNALAADPQFQPAQSAVLPPPAPAAVVADTSQATPSSAPAASSAPVSAAQP
jgi:hypothetical protein